MIVGLRGAVRRVGLDHAVIGVGGFDLKVAMPLTVVQAMPAPGSEVQLRTFLYIHEDVMALFGFNSEDELALFDLLQKEALTKVDRERLKLASKDLLESLRSLIVPLDRWTEKEQTQAEVEVFILDRLSEALPTPPFTMEEKEAAAKQVYRHVFEQSVSGQFASAA